ncbi:DUF1440 domain-containing protein [Corallococcus macrosporus]|uniref:DUF1440 domain-containing protein n=1 Tax=Myxococcus fulvus (strain ATCC BAA-855 / HW-1) TaxID=483219 RepID=F8CHB8_MYXFH|nr:DUF1440 domain-containing protein [Corallococcus macrosporus]AEI66236.1 hypothetical protein LILAB_21680 [Corallococcus macrosporus]
MALGAVAGLLGTLAMTPVTSKLSGLLSRMLKEESGGGSQEPSTEKVARKVLSPLGVDVQGKRKQRLGNLVHFTYGTVWGAIYGALSPRAPLLGKLWGLGFGTFLFLTGDEVAVPALKLAPPPQQTPASSHLGGLAAHWVYGATTETTFRGLSRLAARA